jgi:hypothetical protein
LDSNIDKKLNIDLNIYNSLNVDVPYLTKYNIINSLMKNLYINSEYSFVLQASNINFNFYRMISYQEPIIIRDKHDYQRYDQIFEKIKDGLNLYRENYRDGLAAPEVLTIIIKKINESNKFKSPKLFIKNNNNNINLSSQIKEISKIKINFNSEYLPLELKYYGHYLNGKIREDTIKDLFN